MSRSYKWIPVIDEDACTGCGLCAEACGPGCLNIIDRVALLLSASKCGSEEHCIAVCPEDAIHMQWVPMRGNRNIGRWKVTDEEPDPRADEMTR